jgi:hypothetical protein
MRLSKKTCLLVLCKYASGLLAGSNHWQVLSVVLTLTTDKADDYAAESLTGIPRSAVMYSTCSAVALSL